MKVSREERDADTAATGSGQALGQSATVSGGGNGPVFCSAFVVEGEEAFEDFGVGEGGWPTVSGEDGFVEFAVGVFEPRGALIVKVSEGSLGEVLLRRAGPPFSSARKQIFVFSGN